MIERFFAYTLDSEGETVVAGLPVEYNRQQVTVHFPGGGIQTIQRVPVQASYKRYKHNQRFVHWFSCPSCGRRTWSLLLVPGVGFYCRHCLGLGDYRDLWNANNNHRKPAKPSTWFKQLAKRGKKVLNDG
ncbi:hypothetical protein GFC01_14165 [Desulfofundulus thermobenzoicus]|uniref:Uncharacterized protein n=1 Tax=Desulfofundulus thermobenzoicus TaxID=29376 RepID=A0A6N7ITK4_9FIRM|nr:hypothetical protein [Desulfofundulus thermobenzoicus]MQL53382.1 hypothetical protein [Desulfofundulus thermobenzoicus]